MILQASQNYVAYHGVLGPLGRACATIAGSAAMPVAVHLDHATGTELVREAAGLGFGSAILLDGLGDPVVAAWIPPWGDQRWYVIPDGTDWDTILGWLVQKGSARVCAGCAAPGPLPALPRSRLADRRRAGCPEGRGGAGRASRRGEAEEKLRLEQALREAEGRAEPVRHALVYGTGAELVGAVAQVLTAAGLRSIDLDELGGTRSADLLVGTDGPPLCLVEVKATSGSATENLVNHLQRHLTTWPQLRPDQPVTGRSSSSTTSTGCTRPKEQPTSAPAPSSSPRCPLRSSALWRDTAAIQPPPGSAAPPARHWPGWADNGHHLAQDDGTVSGYRLGHQPGVAVQPLQGLHGGLVGAGPAEPGGDDLTLFGHRLLADDYQVTVGDCSPRSSSRP